MLDGQNIVVDHLVTIIQVLQTGRATGSLIATRGEGTSYESGTLVFLNGRVAQARGGTSGDATGGRVGREALNWLSTWGKCRYTFTRSITSGSVTRRLSGGSQNQFSPQEGKASREKSGLVNETVPYRCKPLEYSLQLLSKKSLSRTHRNVFLLVDGARKIRDLMRLLKLNENEVLTLLFDLQNTGVINLTIPLSL
jgi:hypothetical protein